MTALSLALVLVLAGSTTSSVQEPPFPSRSVGAADERAPCLLDEVGSERAAVAACLACHEQPGPAHPVGMAYAPGAGSSLRDPTEVVRRGVLLPDGEIRCVTCHDRRSPWKYRIALPPGSTVRAAVRPGDPATYDPALIAQRPAPKPGDAVTPKPLCLACHAMD